MPSDSTTTSVPVSATAKLAPETANLGAQELLAQVQPRRRGELGRLVGQVVGRGPTGRRHPAQEDLADLGAVAVDRRHQDVAGQVVTELHDQLGEVGLPGRDALGLSASLSPISWVAIDLTLTTSSTPWRLRDVGDDRVGLGGVAGPVHGRAARGERRLELHEVVARGRAAWRP